MEKTAFVTTGAIVPFIPLIEAFVNPQIQQHLIKCGFTKLVIQHGNAPSELIKQCNTSISGLDVSGFGLKPNLDEDIMISDLIISHAGEYLAEICCYC